MEFNLETIVFYFLAAFITVFSILTVTTRRMVRSATYLLFVDRKSTRLNSSHIEESRMPSSA